MPLPWHFTFGSYFKWKEWQKIPVATTRGSDTAALHSLRVEKDAVAKFSEPQAYSVTPANI
ncbi:MAG: hypothetical protein AUJ04_03115 [Acidobacteria bacterium 13_1_40CM_3_55_6]|nr:MAG: hypothetical protein AUJ04_03115 [Acidobacteria bacterium 13_1_40CM_3_55_6]